MFKFVHKISSIGLLILVIGCVSRSDDAESTGPIHCFETDCQSRHRECIPATYSSYAECGDCLEDAYARGGECVPYTVCSSDEYERAAPTKTSDRECEAISSVCPKGEYEAAEPTGSSDRACSPCPPQHYCAGGTADPEFCRLGAPNDDPTVVCENIIDFQIGSDHGCVLTDRGNLKCWGSNSHGETAVPTSILGEARHLIISGSNTCAIKNDNTALCWGDFSNYKYTPESYEDVRMMAIGSELICALDVYGSAECWGWNYWGEADIPILANGVAQIAAGANYSCVLLLNDEVRCWGHSDYEDVPNELGKVVKLVGNLSTVCAINDERKVSCWGARETINEVPSDLESVVDVALGFEHACALSDTSEVRCWGGNDDGESTPPSDLPPVVDLSLAGRTSCALTEDQAVVCWGMDANGQATPPADLPPVASLSQNSETTCALTEDQAIVCWGRPNSRIMAMIPEAFWP